MNTLQKGITLLLRSGITGEKLPLPEDFSLEEALPVLKKHSVVSLAYQGAANCGIDGQDPSMQKMLTMYYRILMHHEKQDRAINQVFSAFDANGISYMPVKGCNMKKMYPKPELRPMGDADILIREEEYPRIRILLERLGFSKAADTSHVYEWNNTDLHVELHKCLVDKKDAEYHAYYGTGWKFAVPGSGTRYDMRAEDAYVFAFVHFAKHYRGCGIGLRHMMDLYVYRREVPDLDMTYVRRELKKLQLWAFHENIMNALRVWFEDGEADSRTELITDFVFSSGNWGNMETWFLNKAMKGKKTVKNSGIRAVWRTIFPSYRTMAFDHKLLREHPVLLPIYWVRRWILIFTVRRKSVSRKLRLLKQVNDTSVNAHKEALLAVGLVLDREDQTESP